MENNELALEAEETNETAAPGAIDVSEKGITKFEDTVVLPIIPKTLLINGLAVNNDLLKETIEKEVKTMKINGLGDKEGFEAAEAKLKELAKLRTGSNKWRTDTMKPVLKFQKELKGSIDLTGELCTEGETYLEGILKPIKEAVEIARQEEEKRKDLQAKERAKLIVEMGGVLDKGTYKFAYDGGLFVLASSLRALSDEDYEKEIADIVTAWGIESARLQAIEDEKNAEQNRMKTQLEDMNAERTEFREEQMTMNNFVYSDSTQQYSSSVNPQHIITREQLLTSDKDQWKSLLVAPAAPVAEEIVTEAPVVEAKEPAKKTFSPPPAPLQGFTGFSVPEPAKEAVKPKEEVAEKPAAPVAEEIQVLTRSLVFSKAKPYITLALTAKMNIRIYPLEFSDKALEGLEPAFTANVSDNLLYSIIRITT